MKIRNERIQVIWKGDRPQTFKWRGRVYRVRSATNTWFVDTRWWAVGGLVTRTYLRIETDRGEFVIYREKGQWMLLGGED